MVLSRFTNGNCVHTLLACLNVQICHWWCHMDKLFDECKRNKCKEIGVVQGHAVKIHRIDIRYLKRKMINKITTNPYERYI